jgi:MYXO-CTERM domain-containing protein
VHTKTRAACRGIGLVIVAWLGVSVGTAQTVATFADPATDESTPLFTAGIGTLSGGWTGAGLDLVVPIAGMTFADAVFEMDPVVINPDDTLGAGTIRFYEDPGMANLVLQIDFDGGELHEPFGFGASFVSADNVTFSGPVITTSLEDEHFSFSFANPHFTTIDETTYTASFTSSAVPEPATFALAAVGALCLMRRRH